MDSAIVALSLDRLDETFQWLEKGFAEKSGWLVYLKTEPRFNPLRGDSRFESLLRRVELGNP
jgi:hypothetical protein